MKNKKSQSESSDFSAFFPLGMTFLILGMTTMNPAFFGVGAYFLIVALANSKKDDQDVGETTDDDRSETAATPDEA